MRASIVTLKAYLGKTTKDIAVRTSISISTVNRIYGGAIRQGFDPN